MNTVKEGSYKWDKKKMIRSRFTGRYRENGK